MLCLQGGVVTPCKKSALILTVHIPVIKGKAKRDKRGSARRLVCSHPASRTFCYGTYACNKR